MADCTNINTLEKGKFTVDTNGDICVRTCGNLSITGSRAVGAQFSEVTINDTSWTSLISPFSDILVLSVQNKSGFNCKVNPNPSQVGYVGMALDDQDERNYNDLDTGFVLYAKSEPGVASLTLNVEVLNNA